jgi:1,4-alpha-glucan branching enzyme
MVDGGGLGFGYKWNMGWMNDTLRYMAEDPINRKHHHGLMTFGIHYAFSENFILPISHDEVVHGKGSLLDKMPGDGDSKFANLRAYLGFMWAHPGKKLVFMGREFGQGREWNHDGSLDWHLLDRPQHKGVQDLVRDLNATYASVPALHERDTKAEGFDWIEGGAVEESMFVWLRRGAEGTPPALVVANMTPVHRPGRRFGVPEAGRWALRINTDAAKYGGTGTPTADAHETEEVASAGRPHSIVLDVPPLSTLIFELERA